MVIKRVDPKMSDLSPAQQELTEHMRKIRPRWLNSVRFVIITRDESTRECFFTDVSVWQNLNRAICHQLDEHPSHEYIAFVTRDLPVEIQVPTIDI